MSSTAAESAGAAALMAIPPVSVAVGDDEAFVAEQNARLVKNAEEYYRTMFRGGSQSWNLRDRHMAGTLDALVDHLDHQRGHTKVVVWEHNSHVGDARATEHAGYEPKMNVTPNAVALKDD